MIEVGKKYRNLHTGIICEVQHKIFFNVAYLEDGEPRNTYPRYCHYKRFQKNWVEVPDSK